MEVKETALMRTVAVVALSVLGVACSRGAAQQTPQSPPPTASATISGARAPAASAGDAAGSITVSGTILETMDAAGYTYMRLQTPNGEAWVAVNQAKVQKGDSVSVVDAMVMDGFESKSLNRKFDRIVFGQLASGDTGAADGPRASSAQAGTLPPAMMAALAAQHSGTTGGPASGEPIQVAKAEGPDGHTVAEVYAKKAGLEDKQITVRGKVVKSNPGIMGRNWLHIRDGSGSREAKDDDLTVTTQDVAAVGDVVLVRGVVRLDRDFGAGYSYPVILEDAKVSKKD
jgi:hypothetical protein